LQARGIKKGNDVWTEPAIEYCCEKGHGKGGCPNRGAARKRRGKKRRERGGEVR